MPPEKSEQERREMVRQLKQQYAQAQAEQARSEAQTDERLAYLEQGLLRAELPLPDPNACPNCWVPKMPASSLRA